MTQSVSPVYGDLEGKTAVVTGSSQNLGEDIAVTLAEVGVDIGITAKDDLDGCEKTAAAVRSSGSEAAVVLGDLGDPEDIEDIAESVREELGTIDILVNSAAIRPGRPFEEITVEDWQNIHDVNLRSAFLLAQEVIPSMREQGEGTIINILGEMALQGRRGKAHVATMKTGLIGLTLSLAAEFGPEGVRTNGVVPGRKIKTERDPEREQELEATYRKVKQATPLRRRGNPVEVAKTVRFLASSEASYINGQVINVDGGLNPVYDIENIDVGID